MEDRHPNGYIPGNIPNSRQYHYGVGVLWVGVHPGYNATSGEKNVALLTTIWRLQFSSSLYQICLPMPDASDTNIGKTGTLNCFTIHITAFYSTIIFCFNSTTNIKNYIIDPVGGIKYSVKRLRRSRSTRNKRYTNANGMVKYQECDSPCK